MDILERYLAAPERAALEPLSDKRRVIKRTGQVTYHVGERKYERRLGDPSAQPADPHAYMSTYGGAHKGRDPDPRVDHDPAARIADMNLEGVDVNLLLPSGWFGTWTTADTAIELALYGGLLLRLSEPAERRHPGVRPERAGEPGGGRAVRPGAVGVVALLLRTLWYAARSSGPGTVLGGGAAPRPLGRAPHVHRHAALRARRARHVGELVAAALGRASLVRHAQHGRPHRRGCARPVSESSAGSARGRPRVAAVLGQAPGRACPVRGSGPAAAQAEAERLRHRRSLLPDHRDVGRRGADEGRHPAPGRRHPDVRVGLPARRKLVSEIGGHGDGLGSAGAGEAQAVLGQCAAVLPPFQTSAGSAGPCLTTSRRDRPPDFGRSWLATIGCWPCWARPTPSTHRSWKPRAVKRRSWAPASPAATTPHSPTPASSPPPSASSLAATSPARSLFP